MNLLNGRNRYCLKSVKAVGRKGVKEKGKCQDYVHTWYLVDPEFWEAGRRVGS